MSIDCLLWTKEYSNSYKPINLLTICEFEKEKQCICMWGVASFPNHPRGKGTGGTSRGGESDRDFPSSSLSPDSLEIDHH